MFISNTLQKTHGFLTFIKTIQKQVVFLCFFAKRYSKLYKRKTRIRILICETAGILFFGATRVAPQNRLLFVWRDARRDTKKTPCFACSACFACFDCFARLACLACLEAHRKPIGIPEEGQSSPSPSSSSPLSSSTSRSKCGAEGASR